MLIDKWGNMDIQQVGDIVEVTFTYGTDKAEFNVLLMSDEHYDSIFCDRSMLKEHHEKAKELNAPIFKFGDIFDLMGGKWDRRSGKGDVRPEFDKPNYLGKIARSAVEYYQNYPIAFVSTGNHEETIHDHHEFDFIEELQEGINSSKDWNYPWQVARGYYSGWIRFKFRREDGSQVRSMDMYYNHEGSGNAPVTKGVIGTNRNGVNYRADIYVTGHNHNRWEVEVPTEEIGRTGRIKRVECLHINSGTYSTKPKKERKRFDSKHGQPALGGVFLNFRLKGAGSKLVARTTLA